MVQWEYSVLALKTKIHVRRYEQEENPIIKNVQYELNQLGKKGWELVGIQNIRLETSGLFTVAYLKREKV